MISPENKIRDYVTPQEIYKVKHNYGKIKNKYLSVELGWSISKLNRIAKILGLKSNIKHQKYNADMINISSFTSPDIIYCLGYIWADGHIKTIKRSEKINYLATTISILKDDFENVQNSFKSLGYATIKYVYRLPNKPITTWLLCDKILANYLVDMDYYDRSKKEPTKILNKIPEHLRHYWWRGFFDGDGHLGLSKSGCPSIHISSNYNQPWEFCNQFLPFIEFKILRKFKIGGSSSLAFLPSSDALKFLNYIYKNREDDNIGLDRKYDRYLKCVDYRKKTEQDFKYIYYRKDTDRWVVSFKKLKISKTFTLEKDAITYRNSVIASIS